MAQSNGLYEVAVEAKGNTNGSGNLRYLQSVSQAGTIMVTGWGKKHLGLMGQSPECL